MGNIVSRFPGGLNDVAVGAWNEDLGFPDPTRWVTFFEDFADATNSFPLATSGLAAASNAVWTITVTEGGAGDAASAIVDSHGGAISLTTDAADNDLIFVQRKSESYLLSTGKRAYFKARFKITDATANAASIQNTEWYFGLMVTDTDPLSSTAGDGVTDGIFVMGEDTGASTQPIKCYVQKNATTGQLTVTPSPEVNLTVNTMTSLAWAWDGVRYVKFYKDDVHFATADLTADPTAYLPDTEVTISFGIKNGEAVAKVMTVDYIFCTAER